LPVILKGKIGYANSGNAAATRYRHFLEWQHDIALRVSLTGIAAYPGITPQSLNGIRRQLRQRIKKGAVQYVQPLRIIMGK
jgi:hypothetical protein